MQTAHENAGDTVIKQKKKKVGHIWGPFQKAGYVETLSMLNLNFGKLRVFRFTKRGNLTPSKRVHLSWFQKPKQLIRGVCYRGNHTCRRHNTASILFDT